MAKTKVLKRPAIVDVVLPAYVALAELERGEGVNRHFNLVTSIVNIIVTMVHMQKHSQSQALQAGKAALRQIYLRHHATRKTIPWSATPEESYVLRGALRYIESRLKTTTPADYLAAVEALLKESEKHRPSPGTPPATA